MPCFCLTPKLDDFNEIPELQVCIAEALYDPEAVLPNPSAFKAEDIRTLRDQLTSNLERAWEITGRSEDLTTAYDRRILPTWKDSDVLRVWEHSHKPPA